MNNYIQIPFGWSTYFQHPAYFYTYYGDVLHGILVNPINNQDSLFIVPQFNMKAIKDELNSPEVLRQYGWEIKDIRVITDVKAEISPPKEIEPIYNPDKKVKRLFIFGAGASTYCCYGDYKGKFKDDLLNPPLGFEIFAEKYEELCKTYPAVRYSVPDLEMKGNNIEEYFEQDWNKYKIYYRPKILSNHINIQYYLADLFTSISQNVKQNFYRKNLYNLFTNKLASYLAEAESEIPLLVSFNYDTILEDFLSLAFQKRIKSINDYIDHESGEYILFKPHGSCNWGWRLSSYLSHDRKGFINEVYNKNMSVYDLLFKNNFNKDVDVSTSNVMPQVIGLNNKNRSKFTIDKDDISLTIPNAPSYPALLLPYREKDEFIMPERHQLAMKIWSESVEEITVIGWKGHEDLFNKILKGNRVLKKLIIVDPNPDVVIENLKDYLDIEKIEIIRIKDFEDYVINEMDNLLKNDE